MPGMRSSCAALWLTLVLLHDARWHLVHAAPFEDHWTYQACVSNPSCDRIQIGHDQGVSGTIPTEIGLYTSLTFFGVYDTQLGGTMPTEIGLLTSVYELSFWGSRLTGPIPSEIGRLAGMQNCYINNNNLEGSIPTEVGYLTSMNGGQFNVVNNAGLCGWKVPVGGAIGTSYNTDGTSLGNPCPTVSPTSAPTSAPTTASSVLPCCEEMRLNPVFCCIEKGNPELAARSCQECDTRK